MPKYFALLPLLLLAAAASAADPLVGSWLKDGEPAAELRSDHTGAIDSDEIEWSADAGILRFTYPSGEKEKMPYTLSGNVLTVEMNGKTETFTRSAAASKAKAPAPAGKNGVSSLLLSRPWCTYRFDKAGSSKQERLVFRGDGTWRSGEAGRWKVKGSVLSMAKDGEPLTDAGLTVSRDSKGFPVLDLAGKKYSSCH